MSQRASAPRPLHDAFPVLASRLPHITLAQLPTPIKQCNGPAGEVLIKCDGQTHPDYGGNKVRKLEYLLGQALSHGCQRVATFGAAGSNHATATAVHAKAVGLGCINFLSRQRSTPWVSDNLRIQLLADARIEFVDGDLASFERRAREVIGATPGKTWLIPMGGSSLAGTIGYVNAGFELAQQLDRQELTVPDVVYVPLGTMGTVIGLAIGLRAAGLSIPIMAVRVVHPIIGTEMLARKLFDRTVRLLHTLDPTFPKLRFDDALVTIRDDQFGEGYAYATEAAISANAYAKTHWQMALETTYSAKTIAALLADSDSNSGDSGASNPLYWATYSESHPSIGAASPDEARLPPELRRYL